MADEQTTLSASIDDFFIRCGLDPRARLDCHLHAKKLFPDKLVKPLSTQGYCSYTASIDDYIIQFRPPQYKLDLDVVSAAKTVFGTYAPATAYQGTLNPHGLLIYIMERIPGISYKALTLQEPHVDMTIRQRLCQDFAIFLAKAWHRRDTISLSPGPIGSTIKPRLQQLSIQLPVRFRPTVRHIIWQYDLIETLPTVLAHGDITPSNILVDARSGRLCGLVDWAEAEILPFGICLYGLEAILGGVTADNRFVYYADAEQGRAAFWERLWVEIPALRGAGVREAVALARDLGVLLWHGFAFDDGRIDRVVEEGRDCQEICYLDALLGQQMVSSLL